MLSSDDWVQDRRLWCGPCFENLKAKGKCPIHNSHCSCDFAKEDMANIIQKEEEWEKQKQLKEEEELRKKRNEQYEAKLARKKQQEEKSAKQKEEDLARKKQEAKLAREKQEREWRESRKKQKEEWAKKQEAKLARKQQKEELARKQEEKEAIAEFVTRKEYAKMMEDALGEYLAQDDLQDDGVSSQDDTPRMDRQTWISTMQ